MSCHYVHLSTDDETAKQVDERKSPKQIILKINSEQADKNGMIFDKGNDKVWLTDKIPLYYIEK